MSDEKIIGIHSAGLCLVVVYEIDEEKVVYKFYSNVGKLEDEKFHRAKIKYNTKGEPYFETLFGKVLLSEVLKTDTGGNNIGT